MQTFLTNIKSVVLVYIFLGFNKIVTYTFSREKILRGQLTKKKMRRAFCLQM